MLRHGNNNFILTQCRLFEALVEKTVLRAALKKGDCMTYMQSLTADVLERRRANLAQEQQKRDELAETQRSHRVNEEISQADLNEKIRHQIAMDTETMRANRVSEAEIQRHNEETEKIGREANAVSRLAAQLNYNAQIDRNITTREVAELQTQSNELIAAAKNRIDQINSESQRKQAEAALKAASARMNASFASLEDAATRADLKTSQKFVNYTQGARNITSAASDIVDISTSIGTGGLSNTMSQKGRKGQAVGYDYAPKNDPYGIRTAKQNKQSYNPNPKSSYPASATGPEGGWNSGSSVNQRVTYNGQGNIVMSKGGRK